MFLQKADSNDQARKLFCQQMVKQAEERLALAEERLGEAKKLPEIDEFKSYRSEI